MGREVAQDGGFIAYRNVATRRMTIWRLQDAARAHNVDLSIHQIARPEEIGAAIDAAKAWGAPQR